MPGPPAIGPLPGSPMAPEVVPFVPPVTGVGSAAAWLPVDVLEESELLLEPVAGGGTVGADPSPGLPGLFGVGSFVPPVTDVGLAATWLPVDEFEEFELPLEELLESGVQPITKRRTAPARTAASL